METLEELIESLKIPGRVESSGQFAVDLQRSRRLMREHQLDRHDLWLLPLVQLAHLWEAARTIIRFERNAAVVEILACQNGCDLRPWLSQLGAPQFLFHPRVGPLALACEVALAAGFRRIELSLPGHSVSITSDGVRGELQAFAEIRQLKLRLDSPDARWWNIRSRRQWSERICQATRQIRLRGGFSLSQPVIDGLHLRPELDAEGGMEVERVWLSSQPLRQLMAYPGPNLRSFTHEWVGLRLTRWREGPVEGLLRQWVHAEQAALASDLFLDKAQHWMDYLARSQACTFPREVRRLDGYLAARGVLQWSPNCLKPGQLIPLRWGMSLGSLELLDCPGVTAWVSADAWGTDLSQQKVLRNQVVERSQRFVRSQFADLLGCVIEAAQLLPKELGWLIEPAVRVMPVDDDLRPQSVRSRQR